MNKKYKILVACEESGIVTQAFRERGHEAWSCDILPTSGSHPEWHIQGDALREAYSGKYDMMIATPPCTYLSVTANKWLKDQPARKSGALVGQARRDARNEAIKFFINLTRAPIEKICIENPVGIMSTQFKKPQQIIQPFQFGHPEPKKTCLWLKGLPVLFPTQIVAPEYFISKSGKKLASWYYKPSPSPERQKMRSVTFKGIAAAMANQWG